MRIGELAQRTGVTTRALRSYEAQGLLAARRSANGYREYDEDDLQLVEEIQTLQTIGLSLDVTRPFVECLRSGHETGESFASSTDVIRRKLEEADALLARLGGIRAELAAKLAGALARQAPD